MSRSLNLVSLLDNDFYKFTMQNAVIKHFPCAKVCYNFVNRGNHSFPKGFGQVLKTVIEEMHTLKLTNQECDYLEKHCPYFDPTYLEFLKSYRYNPSEVNVIQRGNDLGITIEGLWYRTILWEVPIMAMISELYYKMKALHRVPDEEIIRITRKKILGYKAINVSVAEFGTRRRHSYEVHKLVLKILKGEGKNSFIGSSNVHFAHLFKMDPIGTHAHEWFMFHGAKYGFKMANRIALENWTNVYRGDLGIALSDTYTTDFFFNSFDKKFAKLFDGIRHDSGDPIIFAKNAIKHYKQFKIDPISKTIVFSDALNPKKVATIAKYCRSRIGMSFGIGTNFTNDVGLISMNIVIKMTQVFSENKTWTPAVKLSDIKEKLSGDPDMIELARRFLHL